MTSLVDTPRSLNSSNTPRSERMVAAVPSCRSQDFSSLMRSKQEASRLGPAVPAGGYLVGPLGAALEGRQPATSPLGPRGDEVLSPNERDEFQRDGRDSEGQRPASEGLSPWVDPLQRVLAQPTPNASGSLPTQASAHPNPASAMDELLRGVRRFALGGDRQRSVAYIELGAGALSGAALTLEARAGAISVVLDLPAGVSGAGWAERLAQRLAERGLEVHSVEVH